MGFKRPKRLVRVTYGRFRESVSSTGLIGLVSGTTPIAGLIKKATDSDYSHAFMFGWWDTSCLMVGESDRPASRIVNAHSRVKELSGLIDVYEIRQEDVDLLSAWVFVLRNAGQDYPEDWIINNWLRISFGETVGPVPNSDIPEFPRHCSGLIHAACRVNKFKPIYKHDSDVHPDDWANPKFTKYLCTLVWD